MTRYLAIPWQQVLDTIHKWVCGVTEIDWVWANQDTSQIAYPFGVINVVSGPQKIGLDEHRWDPENERQLITGPRPFTVGFQVSVGEPDSNDYPDHDAISILATLQASTQFEATRAMFREGNIAVEDDNNAIQPNDLQVGADHVSRATWDVVLRTTACTEEAIDPIESAEVSATYDNHPTLSGADILDLTGA